MKLNNRNNEEIHEKYDAIQHIYYCLHDIKFFKEYVNRYERLIKEEKEEYDIFLNDPSKYFKLGPKFNFQKNHSANLNTEFPNTHRLSAFIMLWSYFENSLNVLCEVYEHHLSLNVNFKEMKGNGIDRSKLYLSKICKIEFPTSSYWDNIKKLQKIRNSITHSYIDVNTDDDILKSSIKSFNSIKLHSFELRTIIYFEKSFLEDITILFENFYNELLNSFVKKIDNHKSL